MNSILGKPFVLAFLTVALATLAACDMKNVKKEDIYPTRPPGTDKIVYSNEKRDTIWGEGETMASYFFSKKEDSGSGIGVNSFLWRASLDTLSFMPISSADPFGGVILTDWYENPDTPGERFKINIYIMDKQLRADGVRAAVFKQKQAKGGPWKDASVADSVATEIENTILTRARDLKAVQSAVKE